MADSMLVQPLLRVPPELRLQIISHLTDQQFLDVLTYCRIRLYVDRLQSIDNDESHALRPEDSSQSQSDPPHITGSALNLAVSDIESVLEGSRGIPPLWSGSKYWETAHPLLVICRQLATDYTASLEEQAVVTLRFPSRSWRKETLKGAQCLSHLRRVRHAFIKVEMACAASEATDDACPDVKEAAIAPLERLLGYFPGGQNLNLQYGLINGLHEGRRALQDILWSASKILKCALRMKQFRIDVVRVENIIRVEDLREMHTTSMVFHKKRRMWVAIDPRRNEDSTSSYLITGPYPFRVYEK